MKSAYFVYNNLSGRGLNDKKINIIKKYLSKTYEHIYFQISNDTNSLKDILSQAGKNHIDFIFTGGDGTFNTVINEVMKLKEKPTLGYLPSGTTNDIAKNFKLSNRLKKSLKIINAQEKIKFDLCLANEEKYFLYVAALGAFANISYVTKRKNKKRLGSIAYYRKAFIEAFKPKKIEVEIKTKDDSFKVKVPFVLVLNGRSVAGFKIGSNNEVYDNKFHVYLTRPGLFNGLLHYLFFKIRTYKIYTDEIEIKVFDQNDFWCFDGEKYSNTSIKIRAIPKALEIYAHPKIIKKHCKTKI